MNIYDATLALLTRNGWYQDSSLGNQGGGYGPGGSLCLLRALQNARCQEQFDAYEGDFADLCAPLREFLDLPDPASLSLWNDDPHTTFEDVRLVLKHASFNTSFAKGAG